MIQRLLLLQIGHAFPKTQTQTHPWFPLRSSPLSTPSSPLPHSLFLVSRRRPKWYRRSSNRGHSALTSPLPSPPLPSPPPSPPPLLIPPTLTSLPLLPHLLDLVSLLLFSLTTLASPSPSLPALLSSLTSVELP
jgi:hypothetical protein